MSETPEVQHPWDTPEYKAASAAWWKVVEAATVEVMCDEANDVMITREAALRSIDRMRAQNDTHWLTHRHNVANAISALTRLGYTISRPGEPEVRYPSSERA